jgi:hypothetical protein
LINACSGCGAAVVTDRMKRRERTIKLSSCIAAQARFGWGKLRIAGSCGGGVFILVRPVMTGNAGYSGDKNASGYVAGSAREEIF